MMPLQMSSSIIELDRIIMPVNVGNTHWACAMVDMRAESLYYFDSFGVRLGAMVHMRGKSFYYFDSFGVRWDCGGPLHLPDIYMGRGV